MTPSVAVQHQIAVKVSGNINLGFLRFHEVFQLPTEQTFHQEQGWQYLRCVLMRNLLAEDYGFEDKTLITHPSAFIKRFRKRDHTNIGLALSKEELEHRFNLISSKKPYSVTGEIIFLGEVPRSNDFESQTTTFVDDSGKDDFIPDDSGIVVKLKSELLVISGCAHSGICNIIEHAKQITGIQKVKAVLGGFHLKHNNVQTQKTIEYLKQQKVEQVYPSHCTELPALSAFYENFKIQQLKTGVILNF